jgi:DNA-binding Lrp family transcriptional regulator
LSFSDSTAEHLLDLVSLRIVEELVRNPRATFKEIGKAVGCDQRTVARRVGELEEAGILKVSVELDWRSLGMGASAYVGLSTARSPRASQLLQNLIATEQRVVEAYETLGSNQFFLRIIDHDVTSMRSSVLRDLDPVTGDLATSLVTHVLKPRDYFPLVRLIRETRFPRSRSVSA